MIKKTLIISFTLILTIICFASNVFIVSYEKSDIPIDTIVCEQEQSNYCIIFDVDTAFVCHVDSGLIYIKNNKVVKKLLDGQIVIVKDGIMYNVLGIKFN